MDKKVLAVLVLDESGSMAMIRGKTVSCLNEYVDSLKPRGKMCHFTLLKFGGSSSEFVCDNVPVKDVPKINQANYNPSGGTPLFDAVGKAVKHVAEQVEKSKDDVLFVVMTDGEENMSREYDQRAILSMIAEKEQLGWTFVYLGANQDSWKSAAAMGYVSAQNVVNFVASEQGMSQAMRQLSESTMGYFSDRSDFYKQAKVRGVSARSVQFTSKSFYGTNKKEK